MFFRQFSLTGLGAQTLVVTNTLDDGSYGSLRWALNYANMNTGTDTIAFAIGTGSQTITVSSTDLPGISDTVIIDGSTQSGYSGAPLISLVDGDTRTVGLTLQAGSNGSTIRGLNIQGFNTSGITVVSSNNTIVGNYIGTNAAGTAAAGNYDGINIWAGDNNVIGGIGVNDRNVISGNTNNGLVLSGGANGTQIVNNYIGLNAAGTAAIANGVFGIWAGDSVYITVGGTTSSLRNVISGNGYAGIYFSNVSNSYVYGNYVGTNAAGTGDINGTSPNTINSGLILMNGSSSNLIGNSAISGARNVFSGNNHYGIEVQGLTSTNNTVFGNYIGTDHTGMVALGNSNGGFSFWGSGSGNLLSGNVVSGNSGPGIMVNSAATGSQIQGNYVGLGADGSTTIGNAWVGIYVAGGSTGTLIGTNADGVNDAVEANTISANLDGILVHGVGTTGTMIYGNYIGTDAAGLLDRGNSSDGVRIQNGATVNYIGGAGARRNIIAGNDQDGIQIDGESTDGNWIQNNWIGLAADGTTVLGNGGDGIFINGGADNTTIGGGTGNGNVIVGSGFVGIEIDGASTGTVITSNYVGTNSTGTLVAGSGQNGILLESGASNTTIGGSGAGLGNVITASGVASPYNSGVSVLNTAGTGNSIVGNSIYGNGGIGINLGADGITANDNLDPDSGANNLQNFPVLTTSTVNAAGTTVTVSGSINTLASLTGVVIHFYATPSTGDVTKREGKKYLGSTTVNTDASGNATFNNVSADRIHG
ncbi:MAG: right-handed parallel beta-helix repeat-containing protein [Pirellulaceae bacterium]